MKNLAMKNDSILVAAFDLQKVSVPFGEHSNLFYKHKLLVYDLNITNLISHNACCYVWNQTTAKCGSNEIVSCLKKFIEGLPRNVKKLYLIADNCTGQNKNRFVTLMLLIPTKKKNIEIYLTFLEKWHAQNVNDTIHSVIERANKRVNIHHPYQWITLIEKASRTNPFNVVPMEMKILFNFKTNLARTYQALMKGKALSKESKNKAQLVENKGSKMWACWEQWYIHLFSRWWFFWVWNSFHWYVSTANKENRH